MIKLKKNFRRGERGNVLFLILIAVALFAALSYAVTSSSRSGGGDANDESALVRSAQITQYPSSVRTSMIRMMVSRSIDPLTFQFTRPEDFATLCDGAGTTAACVFHPQGGGATLANVPAEMMAGPAGGEWFFSGNYEIVNIGTSVPASSDGNDIIAFLPGIAAGLCDRINEELGIVGPRPVSAADWDVTLDALQMDHVDYFADDVTTVTDIIGDADTPELEGQAFGCFEDDGGEFIYYHVLLER